MLLMGSSKTSDYEKPYSITGTIKLTGPQKLPKDKCIDRIIGTWKARNIEVLPPMKY